MTTVSAKQAREQFSDLLSRAAYGKERVIVKRHGKQVAALVPIEDLILIEQVTEKLDYRRDVDEAKAARAEVEREGTVSWDDIRGKAGV